MMTEKELIHRALLGDQDAQKQCTEKDSRKDSRPVLIVGICRGRMNDEVQ